MEQQEQTKTLTAISILLVVIALGYLIFIKYDKNEESPDNNLNTNAEQITEEHTSTVNGILLAPKDFPESIPFEGGNVTESVTTVYPDQKIRQLTASYLSSKTVSQKYAEYKDYMTKAGYEVEEGDPNASVRGIFGTSENANLSVVISVRDGKTLVQLAYVLKSTQ